MVQDNLRLTEHRYQNKVFGREAILGVAVAQFGEGCKESKREVRDVHPSWLNDKRGAVILSTISGRR